MDLPVKRRFDELTAREPESTAAGRIPEEARHGVAERDRVVSDQEMTAVHKRQPLTPPNRARHSSDPVRIPSR